MAERVLLLLADGFELLEAAGFTDVLGWADVDGEEPVELVSAGLGSPLRTTFGSSAAPDVPLGDADLQSFDALAIPGGFERAGFYGDALSEPFLDAVRLFHAAGRPIAAVCVASLTLAAAGVLRGRKAAIHHQPGGRRRAQLEAGGAVFVDEAVVVDGALVTSTGPGTATEVAFELPAMPTSPGDAAYVRELMRMPPVNRERRLTPQVREPPA